jgi:hypothetical protein
VVALAVAAVLSAGMATDDDDDDDADAAAKAMQTTLARNADLGIIFSVLYLCN